MTPSCRQGSLSFDFGPDWCLFEQHITEDQFTNTDRSLSKKRYLFHQYSVQIASQASVRDYSSSPIQINCFLQSHNVCMESHNKFNPSWHEVACFSWSFIIISTTLCARCKRSCNTIHGMGIVSFQVLIGEVMGLEMLPMHTSSSVALLLKMRGNIIIVLQYKTPVV